MAQSRRKKVVLERVYVWELPVRLTHWVIFFSIIILSATGYYIGNPFISVPGAARDHFVMGTVRAVHTCMLRSCSRWRCWCGSIGCLPATAMRA